MVRSGVNLKYVSSRTVRRLLNKNGYRYLQARKKGILSDMDIRRRSQFAKKNEKRIRCRCLDRQNRFLP